jgi:lipopolysaccharide transport system ATP-binding protein
MPTSSERTAVGSEGWGVTATPALTPATDDATHVAPSALQAPLQRALSLRNVGKSYNVAGRQATTLAEHVADWVGRARTSSEANRFWALRDVTCEIGRGEIVGLVGRNGAGKSTLLKVITGVTTPSTGEIDVYGRIGSLLEVGTGFHPELTGRENVFLNGAFIGMRRTEIRQRFDEIVEFSGVEAFLDMPIKRYSSGMAVRLAFAVAAHLDADILLVDEVLAVGDQAFQDKCLGKMREVRQREGRTVLFVSHNLAAVASLCTRALLMQSGRVIADASAAEICRMYTAGVATTTSEEVDLTPLPRAKRSPARFTAVRVNGVDASGRATDGIVSGGSVEITLTIAADQRVSRAVAGVDIVDERGRPAAGVSTDSRDVWFDVESGGIRRITLTLHDVELRAGAYTLGLTLRTMAEVLDEVDAVVRFEVEARPDAPYERWPGWPQAGYLPRYEVAVR